MTTDNITRFILLNGVPEIVTAFWSYSESTEINTSTKGSILPFYGKQGENRPELWCHFRVKDLFVLYTSLSTGEIPKEPDERGVNRRIYQAKKDPDTQKVIPSTQIIIDLFAFKTNDRDRMLTVDFENSLELVKSRITNFADITVDIAPLGKVRFDDNYCGQYPENVNPDNGKEGDPKFVLRIKDKKEPLIRYVQLKIKSVNNFQNKSIWDICFKLDLTDEFYDYFLEMGDTNESLFAWAWVLNWGSWKQYNNLFNIDIMEKKDRLTHLQKNRDGNNNFVLSKIRELFVDTYKTMVEQTKKWVGDKKQSPYAKRCKWLEGTRLGEITSSYQENKNQYGKDTALPDPYPFDEPFCNFIAFRRVLPISEVILGVDVGYPIGICEPEGKDFAWYERYSNLNEQNYGEYFAWIDKYLLKEKSADLWFKTIEKDSFHNEDFSTRCNKPIIRKDFPFETSTPVPLKCIDLMVNKVSKGNNEIIRRGMICPVPIDRIDYMWIIEDESIDGLELKNDGEEVKSDSAKMMFYKGFAVNDKRYRFIGVSHNKVGIRGRNDEWQAHSVCQRAIYLMIGVEQDFSEEDMERYNANPLTVRFEVTGTVDDKVILFNKPLKLKYGLKQGIHLFVMYPQFVGIELKRIRYPEYWVSVSAPENLIPIQNHSFDESVPLYGNYNKMQRIRIWERSLEFKVAQIKEHDSFVPAEHGLFKDNPLVIIDDVRDLEAISKFKKKVDSDCKKDVFMGLAKFAVSYKPADDDIGDWLEMFLKKDSEGKESSGIKADEVLQYSLVVSEIVAKLLMRLGIKTMNLDRVTIVTDLIKHIYDSAKKFSGEMKKILHPFMDTVDFGMSPDQLDSLYIIAATRIKRSLDPKSGRYTVINNKNDLIALILLNRFIDVGKPFNYQMDRGGGYVERPEKFRNETDSVSIYRVDFHKNLENARGVVRKVKADADNNMGNYYNALTNSNALSQIFSKTGCNFNPQFEFFAEKEKENLRKVINCPHKMTKDEIIDSITVLKFLQYIDAGHPICPKCRSVMKISWGWCPYHGTRGKLKLIEDKEDVNYKEEFSKKYGGVSVNDMRNDNYLVHWTEFFV